MFRRDNIKLIVVATVCLLVGLTAPAVAHGDFHAKFAHNAHKVDGKHAVGAGAGINQRKGKLVATKVGNGRLPNNIIAKAPDANLVDGINSPQLQFPTSVPVGQTVRGSWGFDVDTDGSGNWAAHIYYPAQMPSLPEFHYLESGDAPTAECPGSVEDPQATLGYVCVYEAVLGGTTEIPFDIDHDLFGFNLLVNDNGAAGDMYGAGTWAAQPAAVSVAKAEAKTGTRK